MTLDQSAWLAIGFVVFLYFAYKPVRNAILSALDEKIAKIRKDVESAKNLPKQAEAALTQVRHEIAEADKKLEIDLAESRAEIELLAHEKTIELENILKQKEENSLQRVSYITENAIKQIHSEQIDSARNIVNNYLGSIQGTKKDAISDLEIAQRLLSSDSK